MLYVLDTSIILSDPKCLEKLSDKHIVIPLVVISELEAKRNHTELGYAARTALRELERLRQENHSLKEIIPTEAGGSVRIEINNIDESGLPAVFQDGNNDSRILAVAANLAKDNDVILATKDLPLRLRASVVDVEAQDLVLESIDVSWSGLINVDSTNEFIDELYANRVIEFETDQPLNTCVIFKSTHKSALGRLTSESKVELIQERKLFGIEGRTAEQRFAIDLMSDPGVGIVSLAGKAGTGKSSLALAAGLESVLESKDQKKITIFRPIYAVGGQDVGYLPGDMDEKMLPWTQAIFDCLEAFCDKNVIDYIISEDLLEVLPLTHIRGRTLTNSFVIIEEAQNLDSMVLLTALSRVGRNSQVVLTHDVSQRDNLRVGRYDGVSSVISKLAGHKLFGHITLHKSQRSAIAELASTVLDM